MNWQEFEKEIEKLSKKINFTPDFVVGITRGGVIPARLLCKYLGVRNMHCISVKKVENERVVTTETSEDLAGKNILLVEDILETGRSLEVAKEYLGSKGANVQTVCLYITPRTQEAPDYYLEKIAEVIDFPWE